MGNTEVTTHSPRHFTRPPVEWEERRFQFLSIRLERSGRFRCSGSFSRVCMRPHVSVFFACPFSIERCLNATIYSSLLHLPQSRHFPCSPSASPPTNPPPWPSRSRSSEHCFDSASTDAAACRETVALHPALLSLMLLRLRTISAAPVTRRTLGHRTRLRRVAGVAGERRTDQAFEAAFGGVGGRQSCSSTEPSIATLFCARLPRQCGCGLPQTSASARSKRMSG